MNYWRPARVERPEVMSGRNFAFALAVHVGLFVVFWVFALCHGLFDHAEEIIPIDLTVVVNENLDGKENEPPPLVKPADPPPPPKPEPKKAEEKKLEEPKPLEQMVIENKKKVEKKKEEPPKKVEPKKEEPPKKSAKELREERIKKMRESATKVAAKKIKIEVKNAPSGDGKTAKQTMSEAEIRKLLAAGYKPGTENQLAPNEMSRCLALIQRALNEKWSQVLPQTGRSGMVRLSVRVNSAGGLVDVRITSSCGDRLSDNAALSVAKGVSHIAGLGDAFIAEYSRTPFVINYKVNGQ